MTGPEHYREAERLLSAASYLREPDGLPVDPAVAAHHLAMAQVHATLALAAAQVINTRKNADEWAAAAGPRDGEETAR